MELSFTRFNAYFPDSAENELHRDSLIRNIYNMFSPDNPAILIDGPEASGKTIFLSQFSKYYDGKCISYFIHDNQWSTSLSSFLLELCLQMKELPAIAATFKKEISNDLSVEQLMQLFYRMHRELIFHLKSTKQGPYFFVIDGLDKVKLNNLEDNIIRFLPPVDQSGVYLLLSSNGNNQGFPKTQVVPLQNFSYGETLQFFNGYLDKKKIEQIHEVTEGMPGYLAEILNNIKDENFESLLADLPTSFGSFLEKQWEKLQPIDNASVHILSAVVYSPEPINIQEISTVLDMDKQQIVDSLNKFSFIHVSESEFVHLHNSYKTLLIEKLKPQMTHIVQLLIDFYEKKQIEESASVLPSLYQKSDNYESLVKLMNVENLTKILGTQRSSSLLRKNLRSLSEMAYDRNDNQRLFWAALTESFFTQMISTPPTIEYQVNVLLAQDNFEQAINLAYACFLPEDRLLLLAKIGNDMKRKDQPVPTEILKTIEESVDLIDNTVEFTESLADKLLDICTDLVTIQTNVALKLIEKVAESKGNSDHKNKLMDTLLTNVLIKVGPDDTSAEKIKSQLSNDSLQDFARAASSVLEKLAIDEVYKQVEQIQDISAKVYFLQSWCNTNRKHEHLCEVIKYALDLMNKNPEYAPTQLQLRQLAQCLLTNIDEHEEIKIKSLVEQFDVFKDTIIKQPIDENARLELILAQIINRWSAEEATERFYNVYFSIDSIPDIDIRCLVVVRLLLTHNELAPLDKKLEKEFLNELNIFFDSLLNSSADHLAITKKIIAAITRYNHELAREYSGRLNTAGRRDYAYGELLRQYTVETSIPHSLNFIYMTLDSITSSPYREWVFVQILKRFERNGKKIEIHEKLKYLERIQSIIHPTGRAFAFAYFIVWIFKDNEQKGMQLFDSVKEAFDKIDCLWEQVQVGFEVSEILANASRELSVSMYFIAESQKNSSIFADRRITDLYLETIKLLIRITPDIFNKKDYRERVYLLIKAIEQLPSTLQRSILLASLALKSLTYGKKDLFNDIAKNVLKELDNCKDETTVQQILMETSPMLYEIERNILFEKLSPLPDYMKDEALVKVLKYLFSKRMPIDPIDISNFPARLDFPEALKVVEIIEHLKRDSFIYVYVDKLIESITERKNNKFKTHFNERQVLGIVERLHKLIEIKLPDRNNIQHDGFKIACRASMTKLKDALKDSNAFRANTRWDVLDLNWESIKKEINRLPNFTDKVFLQATLASDAFLSGNALGEVLISNAENNLPEISNSIDRAEKFHMVAKSYHQMSNSKAAKFLLQESLRQSNAFSNHETRDQLLGNIVELAHSIDPNFASGLANEIDSPMFVAKSREKLLALNLRNDPSKLDLSKRDQYLPVISTACTKILNSLYSGRGVALHENVISKWMYCCLGYDFETVCNLVLWYVENSILSRSPSLYTSKLDSLYSDTLSLLDMISSMGNVSRVTTVTNANSNFLEMMAPRMHTFNLGQRDFAIDFLKNWIRENTDEYIKIYDYYFSYSDIEILKCVPQNANVHVLASTKQGELDVRAIQERYRQEWKNTCDQVPPETKIYIFATPSGRTPQHDRFIITDKAGLALGTSLNGLGSRDSVINVLDVHEKSKIEKDIIDPLIINPPRFVGEEKLICRTFSLDTD